MAKIKQISHTPQQPGNRNSTAETTAPKNELAIEEIKALIKNSTGTISDYAINLSYLKIQLTTIQTQLQNHQLLIHHIEAQARLFGETNLNALRTFNQVVEQRYIKQIEQDYASLSPGLEALTNLLNPIQSLVDLEEGERERRLENLIAAASVGIGTASVASSALAGFVKEIREPQIVETPKTPASPPSQLPLSGWSNFWFVFWFSLLIGALFSGVTWLSLQIFRSWNVYWKDFKLAIEHSTQEEKKKE